MTDCSSIQGSTSSSSDAMSSRGGSNNSAASGGSGNSRVRIIRMIRPNARRIILGPEHSIGFGFAIRGGKEFNTGFFVSKVDKGSEADLRGLKVGDQIIRVNSYHVDDAIHKELTQFISSQDRLTLKVRGVGMIPIKEKTLDPLTWHIVPRHALATTLTALDEQMTSIGKDVRVVLKVQPKTKLGLGICKGPEWKPGIFVQFTKDYSVARESGLRPGDQILTCNSIDFSDVLFSEAVAVMKSSNLLEMIVRTGAGLDLFPGESSGYNSSASSITGDQSPCWADQSAKRLSMVREEPALSQTKQHWLAGDANRCNLDRRKTVTGIPNSALHQAMQSVNRCGTDESNKTIIQLSDSGTLINNTIINNSGGAGGGAGGASSAAATNNVNNYDRLIVRPNTGHLSSTMSSFISPDYHAAGEKQQQEQQHQHHHQHQPNCTNQHSHAANGGGNKANSNKIADICFVSRQSETKTVIVEVHRSDGNEENGHLKALKFQQQQQHQQQHMNNYSDNNMSNSSNISGQPIYSKIQPQQQREQNTATCPRPPPPMMPLFNTQSNAVSPSLSSSSSSMSSAAALHKPLQMSSSLQPDGISTTSMSSSSTPSVVSSAPSNGHERSPSVSSSVTSAGGTSLSSAIEEELKKRKERLSQNTNQKASIDESLANAKQQQQQQTKRIGNPILGGNDARHNALMDEFKAAHRRMFRANGNETEMERQEELKKTTIMRDETDHRSPPPPPPPKVVSNHKSTCAMLQGSNTVTNGHATATTNGHNYQQHSPQQQQQQHSQHSHQLENGSNGMNGSKSEYNGNHGFANGNGNVNGTNGQYPTPPPPPQFANKPPMGKKIFASINAFNAANGNANGHNNELQRTLSQNYHINLSEMSPPDVPPPPPPPLPQSPVPDYESVVAPPSPAQTLQKHHQYNHTNGNSPNISTLGRVAASEVAKANGDMAELESIDSYQMINPSSPSPKPPSAYFVPPNSGPPTMKKSNRPVSVTIGEYGASKGVGRREPGKFDFISRSGSNSPSDLGSPMSPMSPMNGKDENVTHMLRSELELTLSRSNLKKRHESVYGSGTNGHTVVQYNNGVYQNGTFQHNGYDSSQIYAQNGDNSNGLHQNGGGYSPKLQNGGANNRNIAYQSNSSYVAQSPTSVKQPLTSNVEKITSMLQNMNGNGIYESSATLNGMKHNGTADKNLNGANPTRVTISLPNSNKIDLRKTDSSNGGASVTAPSNGILKNSMNGSRNSFGDKSITFGN